jgi:hypothetical protein
MKTFILDHFEDFAAIALVAVLAYAAITDIKANSDVIVLLLVVMMLAGITYMLQDWIDNPACDDPDCDHDS